MGPQELINNPREDNPWPTPHLIVIVIIIIINIYHIISLLKYNIEIQEVPWETLIPMTQIYMNMK